MSSLERKYEKQCIFTLKPDPQRKTSAEIVTEASCSLRTTDSCSGRPPLEDLVKTPILSLFSSFSIKAYHFEAPDFRPGSGTRLSPLENVARPRQPQSPPQTPSDPLDLKTRVAGARPPLLRAGCLTTLPPVAGSTEGKGRWREREK
uniref:Uncharacterized protein n=1 Tax=Oncorhynchus tshawytscha TaxID=74940 RepID=A0A8C8GJA2_ONCTS